MLVDSGVDSRQYIFSFPIDSLSAVPADFATIPNLPAIRAGAFLPRSEAGRFRGHRYPPRMLFVTDREVLVVAHPAEPEPVLRLPVNRIETIEWTRMLLLGWMILSWEGGSRRLQYNTRSSGPIERVLRTMYALWLAPDCHGAGKGFEVFGEALNLKFENARAAQLLPGETAVVQFFQPAVRRTKGCWGLRRETWMAGHLLLATSRRLLWITERYKGLYAIYGTVSCSAPLKAATGVRCEPGRSGNVVEITFRSGNSWRVPLGERTEAEASALAAAIRAQL